MDTVVTDAKGEVLSPGDRIKLYGYHEDNQPGMVKSISDPDGDVDDYGRGIAIHPKVTVRYDDGNTEDFETHSLMQHYDDDPTYQCDDLEKIS